MSGETQRAMMAADLTDIAGTMLRGSVDDGRAWTILFLARGVLRPYDAGTGPEECYRMGLQCAGLTPEQIDAAVAAIERGEWPADSLAGRVAEMSADARSDAAMLPMVGGRARGICDGKREAFDKVLDLLGVKP